MFDARETEGERLDRLGREEWRRKWDSARLGRSRDDGTAPAEGPANRGDVSGDDRPLLDLMAERLDLLERKASRIEADVRVRQQALRRLRRRLLAAGLVAAVCSVSGATLAACLSRNEPTTGGDPVADRELP
jgi:hypothetical protein